MRADDGRVECDESGGVPSGPPIPTNFSPPGWYLTMQPDDETLVADCLRGNGVAFEILVGRYEKLVYNVARRMVGQVEDARDIAQTVFLKVFENLKGFDRRYRFRSWITRITINESINHLGARKGAEPLDERWPSAERGPGEIVSGAERSRAVDVAVRGLQLDYRVVIVLRHFLEYSYREMATILEIPEKTVKSRLFTARQLLKDALASQGAMES